MTSLIKAIRNALLESDSIIYYIDDRVYFSLAPPETVTPEVKNYITFSISRANKLRSMGTAGQTNRGHRIVIITFQVWVNSDSQEEALVIGELIENIFECKTISLNDSYLSRGSLESDGPTMERIAPYWLWEADFNFYIEKIEE